MKAHQSPITSFLWFNNQAAKAVDFYTQIFQPSAIGSSSFYSVEGQEMHGQQPGSLMTQSFKLLNQPFIALNGGDLFQFNPTISFFVSCTSTDEIDQRWKGLAADGQVLMPLDSYPFSSKYGWVMDRFGVSWQLILATDEYAIRPCLMFTGEQHGKAAQAMELYTSIFEQSNIGEVHPYEPNDQGVPGTIKHAKFSIHNTGFVAMDSHLNHRASFNEATSFLIETHSQQETDFYWDKLSVGGDPQAQRCGWLKDQFGVSWQIVPKMLNQLLSSSDSQKSKQVLKAFFQMKKINIAELERAYHSN